MKIPVSLNIKIKKRTKYCAVKNTKSIDIVVFTALFFDIKAESVVNFT